MELINSSDDQRQGSGEAECQAEAGLYPGYILTMTWGRMLNFRLRSVGTWNNNDPYAPGLVLGLNKLMSGD